MSVPQLTAVMPKRSRVTYPTIFLVNVPYTVMLGLAGFSDNHIAGYIAFALCLLGTVSSGIVGSKRPAPKTRKAYFVEHFINGAENSLVAAAAFGHVEVIFIILFLIHLVATGGAVLLILLNQVLRRSKRVNAAIARAQVRQMAEQLRDNGEIPADVNLPSGFPSFKV